MKHEEEEKTQMTALQQFIVLMTCILTTLAITVIALSPIIFTTAQLQNKPCEQLDCAMTLVSTTIPPGNETTDTWKSWVDLISSAKYEILISSFYWNLSSEFHGDTVMNALIERLNNNVIMEIAVTETEAESLDLNTLNDHGAKIYKVHVPGIQHSKFILVDRQHFYLGSANMDFRSLTVVKEVGLTSYNCPCHSQDLERIFRMIKTSGKTHVDLSYDIKDQFLGTVNGETVTSYFSVSPMSLFKAAGTFDLVSIIDLIDSPGRYVDIAVMDYGVELFNQHKHKSFWSYLDNAIRKAVVKGKHVRMMASCWTHSSYDMFPVLGSLAALKSKYNNIDVAVYTVNATKEERTEPYTRTNHNKYALTDDTIYIGTSNWQPSYFVDTVGVGLRIKSKTMRRTLYSHFNKDWELAKIMSPSDDPCEVCPFMKTCNH